MAQAGPLATLLLKESLSVLVVSVIAEADEPWMREACMLDIAATPEFGLLYSTLIIGFYSVQEQFYTFDWRGCRTNLTKEERKETNNAL